MGDAEACNEKLLERWLNPGWKFFWLILSGPIEFQAFREGDEAAFERFSRFHSASESVLGFFKATRAEVEGFKCVLFISKEQAIKFQGAKRRNLPSSVAAASLPDCKALLHHNPIDWFIVCLSALHRIAGLARSFDHGANRKIPKNICRENFSVHQTQLLGTSWPHQVGQDDHLPSWKSLQPKAFANQRSSVAP